MKLIPMNDQSGEIIYTHNNHRQAASSELGLSSLGDRGKPKLASLYLTLHLPIYVYGLKTAPFPFKNRISPNFENNTPVNNV